MIPIVLLLEVKSVQCPRCFCLTVIIRLIIIILWFENILVWYFYFVLLETDWSPCILIECLEIYVPVQQ